MAWQGQWGTAKASNARAAALYYEVSNVGKTIESSKKRVLWRVQVEEGRAFEIALTHSLASGKKVLRVDGIVKYTCQSLPFGDWDYVFTLAGGHCVHIIIKPSVDLNDMYDLIVDGMSFRRLPNRLDLPKPQQPPQANDGASASRPAPGSNGSLTYTFSHGSYVTGTHGHHEHSSSPWECTQCTFVNDKPYALSCEACGSGKPDYICTCGTCLSRWEFNCRHFIAPESRDRAKTVASTPPLRPRATTLSTDPTVLEMWSTLSSLPANKQRPSQDITSMLSGLDFTLPPVEETSPPMATALEPLQSEDIHVSAKKDLWSSDMVNLNLKLEEKPLAQRPAKSFQTLEQARQLAPKDKVQILPTPQAMVFPTHHPVAASGGANDGMVPAHTILYHTSGTGAIAPGLMGYGAAQSNAMGTDGGFVGHQVSPFVATALMNALPRQSCMQNVDTDPFATLW